MTVFSPYSLRGTNTPATFVEAGGVLTIVAVFNGGMESETVYLNGIFTHKYATGSTHIGDNWSVVRKGGWPSDFLLGVDTSNSSGASLAGLQVTELSSAPGTTDGDVRACNGFAAAGDGGGGLFSWAAGVSAGDDGYLKINATGGQWQRVETDELNVRWFGALGTDVQTTQTVSSYTSDISITTQTADGNAINLAIRAARARYQATGRGSTIYIPRGSYRVWAYLESIDFSVRIVGDGPGATVIKNCDTSPTNASGYGVLRTGPNLITGFSSDLTDVVLENLTIDGNADARSSPSELRHSPLAIYGAPRLKMSNVEVLNGPLDALFVNYESPGLYGGGPAHSSGASLVATNCRFSRSYRNTASLISGNNQHYTNCIFEYGGAVHGGTSPKAAIDIEPNSHTDLIRDITFTNCLVVSSGVNLGLSVSWAGNVRFVGSNFVAEDTTSTSASWRWATGVSEVSFDACKFRCTGIAAKAYFWTTAIDTAGSYSAALFKQTQYTRLNGCEFEGVGLFVQGRSLEMQACKVVNSACPVLVEQSAVAAVNDVRIRGLTLINVIDVANFGAGATAAFAVKPSVAAKRIEVDGVTVLFDSARLPATTTDLDPGTANVHGVYIVPTLDAAGAYKFTNVHVEGFYRKLPTFFGESLNTSKYRDWGVTTSPSDITCPADTAGVTATAGTIYWKNCTMYGDAA